MNNLNRTNSIIIAGMNWYYWYGDAASDAALYG